MSPEAYILDFAHTAAVPMYSQGCLRSATNAGPHLFSHTYLDVYYCVDCNQISLGAECSNWQKTHVNSCIYNQDVLAYYVFDDVIVIDDDDLH